MDHLKADLASVKLRLAEIEVHEAEARSLLAYVLHEKRRAQRSLHRIEERLTIPINRLPVEILLEVFQYFCDSEECFAQERPVSRAGSLRAVVVSHVCLRWRHLALDTPSLWTSLRCTSSGIVRALVTRSRQLPLDIIVGTQRENGSFKEENLAPGALCLLLPLAPHRWKSVQWMAPRSYGGMDILETLRAKDPFQALRRLSLSVPHKGFADTFGPVAAATQTPYPILEFLSLACVPPKYLASGPIPSLRVLKLQDTHLTTFFLSDFAAFLQQAPALEDLSLDNSHPVLDTSLPHIRRACLSRLLLPRLRTFTWSRSNKEFWVFFHLFETPVLDSLSISFDGCVLERWPHAPNFLVARTFVSTMRGNTVNLPRLRHLSLEIQPLSGLSSVFRTIGFPSLQTLSLSAAPPFHQLPELDEPECIFRDPRFPSLTTLSLSNLKLPPVSTRTLLKYMPTLESLALDNCTNAGKLICLLAGDSCADAAGRTPWTDASRTWLCPRLVSIALTRCADVKFTCVSALVKTRRACADAVAGSVRPSCTLQLGSALCPTIPRTPERPIKPLRRRTQRRLSEALASSASGPRDSGAPQSPAMWPGHRAENPTSVRILRFVGCARVLLVEAISLRDEPWGVLDVSWDAT